MSEQSGERLLHAGAEVSFADIESALRRSSNDESKHVSGMALTATVVVAGPPPRLAEAAQALSELIDAGLRAVLISYGDNPSPRVHVSRQTVSLEGLRPEYLNNAVAALRLSSLPTAVWWRGGQVEALTGLAALSDRLVLDAEDPREVWSLVDNLAERTAVSDLRWTRLTRWRALMAQFFDIADIRAAAAAFRVLRIEGSDRHAARLYAGWLASTLHWDKSVVPDLREIPGAPPIEAIALGDGSQELTLRLADNHTCVETAARINGRAPTSRIVSMGNQGLAALVGEELRIRARDLAFERAVAAAKEFK
jgi:glucose-6-phosphate dehydrogenase assembly protein OpcA